MMSDPRTFRMKRISSSEQSDFDFQIRSHKLAFLSCKKVPSSLVVENGNFQSCGDIQFGKGLTVLSFDENIVTWQDKTLLVCGLIAYKILVF